MDQCTFSIVNSRVHYEYNVQIAGFTTVIRISLDSQLSFAYHWIHNDPLTPLQQTHHPTTLFTDNRSKAYCSSAMQSASAPPPHLLLCTFAIRRPRKASFRFNSGSLGTSIREEKKLYPLSTLSTSMYLNGVTASKRKSSSLGRSNEQCPITPTDQRKGVLLEMENIVLPKVTAQRTGFDMKSL